MMEGMAENVAELFNLRTMLKTKKKEVDRNNEKIQRLQETLKLLNEKHLMGYMFQKQKKPAFSSPADLCLFVKYLSCKTDEESLKKYFEHYGEIADILIPKNHKGQDRRHAFITFSSYFSENPLCEGSYVVDKTKVSVQKVAVTHNPKREHVEQSKTIMLTGVLHDTSTSILETYFNQFGPVKTIIRPRDASRNFKRFSFVQFNDTSSVDQAVRVMQHLIHDQVIDIHRVKDQ